MPPSTTIQELARTIQEACSTPSTRPARRHPTGWPEIDEALAEGGERGKEGLPGGVIHEWFGLFEVAPPTSQAQDLAAWLPPLTIMIHLARRADGPVVWIGRRCWPYPLALGPDLLARSIFVDVTDLRERAWALDVSLRCRGLDVVIGDGALLNMSATRRLQLAAAEGGSLALILRPPRDLSHLSAASTRWAVSPAPSPLHATESIHRWTLRLLRRKGLKQPDHDTWTLELNETGALHLVPDAGHRSGAEERPQDRAHSA